VSDRLIFDLIVTLNTGSNIGIGQIGNEGGPMGILATKWTELSCLGRAEHLRMEFLAFMIHWFDSSADFIALKLC
jgi:hypothetical protein